MSTCCRRSDSKIQRTHGGGGTTSEEEEKEAPAPRTVLRTPPQEGKPPDEGGEIDEEEKQPDRSQELSVDQTQGRFKSQENYHVHGPETSDVEEAESSRRTRGTGNTRDAAVLFVAGSRSPTQTLEERLVLWERGWRPPALRELPSGGEGFFSRWTYFGQPERFELVKSANR